jgi:hypothetical protein
VIAPRVVDEIERQASYEEMASSMSFPEIDAQSYREAACYLWKRADRSERDGLIMVGISTHYARFLAMLCQHASGRIPG